MRTNVPIYRAKSNEGKNNYVEGFLIGVDKEIGLCTIRTKDDYIGGEICYLHTLAIHFPDMLDSQGNKIFASLQEDGIGGDIIHHKKPYCKDDRKYYEWNVKFDKHRITPFAEREYWNPSRVPLKDILTNPKAYIKVIGIQE